MTDQHFLRDSSADDNWDALARYVAGEGTPEERDAIRRMLEVNPARAALVDALDHALRMPEPVAPSSAEVEAALASVLDRRDDRRTGPNTRRVPVVPISAYRARWQDARLRAAAAVLVVAGAGLLWRTMSSAPSGNPSASTPARYATAVGKIDSLTLSDGTHVLLGPGSELTLAQGFGASTRELTLKGEARFDVAHDSTRAFIVHTAAATFRDVGTVFAVHSDEAEGARVVVTAGAVAVEGKLGVTPVVLRAGDRAVVARAGTVLVERAAATSDDLAWTSGKLIFRDAPVEQVKADLRRWYGIDLRVDSALAGRTVTATFERATGTDVGRVIAAMLGGGLRDEGGVLRIVAPPASPPPR
jgi:transmembrane sensor